MEESVQSSENNECSELPPTSKAEEEDVTEDTEEVKEEQGEEVAVEEEATAGEIKEAEAAVEEIKEAEAGVEEAEAEAEPCTEEVVEPVEAILIDDVEIESVSDNIDTGSEKSSTSDSAGDVKKQETVSCKLLLGAVLVAFIAVFTALLFIDIATITKAIPFVQPEPEPETKPFWKIF